MDVDGSISDSGSDDSKDSSQEVKLSGKVTNGLYVVLFIDAKSIPNKHYYRKALHDSIQEL